MGILESIGGSGEVTLLISVMAIACGATSAYISYRIYLNIKISNHWLFITVGSLLVVVHWFLAIPIEKDGNLALRGAQRIVDFVLGMMFIWGFWSINKEMDKISKAEKKADEKIVFMNSA